MMPTECIGYHKIHDMTTIKWRVLHVATSEHHRRCRMSSSIKILTTMRIVPYSQMTAWPVHCTKVENREIKKVTCQTTVYAFSSHLDASTLNTAAIELSQRPGRLRSCLWLVGLFVIRQTINFVGLQCIFIYSVSYTHLTLPTNREV